MRCKITLEEGKERKDTREEDGRMSCKITLEEGKEGHEKDGKMER